MSLAVDLLRVGSGQKVRRLTLFDDIQKAPESGASRMLITNANRYGLISGSYAAEYLELTPDGAKAVDESAPAREQARIRVKLAIQDIEPFNHLYERFKGTKLPARAVLIDAIKEQGVADAFAEEGVDTFVVNLRFVGLLQTLSGAERIITVEHLTDMIPASGPTVGQQTSAGTLGHELREPARGQIVTQEHADFQTTCFYITPIGETGSEQRAHSDLFLGNIVEPALEPFSLKVIRADAIDKPGMITRQVIEYIMRARLVIADLSFHNPNVFYELALRHATRLPVVQIVRVGDSLPFDIGQMRTIRIDNSTIYSLVPKIETYRSEIGSQVRRALESDADADTPISTYFPGFRAVID
ncbi:hypothetical protein [Reyranella sp.]|uniref:hypothetical protein n=1 Tax=Reyranella sp. TaxID=1929291 RepID=UPI003BAA4EB5